MMRKIIHVDMDAFFASVEQRDDPALRGKPLAVGGAGGRGVVAAASYEARTFGVRSAMPSATARRKCPHLLFVPPRFDVYRQLSTQIRAIFADYTSLVEPLSLDEAYLDVTENLKHMPHATDIAREIKARILKETGLTASAGVSYNKFLAKLASDYRKPDGLWVIPPGKGMAFVAPLPVGRFHGIGPVTAARMNQLGILTGADLRKCPLPFLQGHFGKAGGFYHSIARGIDDREVRPDRPRKSIGSETTFAQDLDSYDALLERLRPCIDSVWKHVERHRMFGRTVTLKARYSDFRIITRSRTSVSPVAARKELERGGAELLSSLFPLPLGIRLIGISLSNLTSADDGEAAQLALAL